MAGFNVRGYTKLMDVLRVLRPSTRRAYGARLNQALCLQSISPDNISIKHLTKSQANCFKYSITSFVRHPLIAIWR